MNPNAGLLVDFPRIYGYQKRKRMFVETGVQRAGQLFEASEDGGGATTITFPFAFDITDCCISDLSRGRGLGGSAGIGSLPPGSLREVVWPIRALFGRCLGYTKAF
ncbi:hypothetical protein NDU88_004123 [Pleurodeles waltl]|uniref:Uncharacterized protein n=1 Tax=Pleurodeles waltl TaxID=8319 RepID=A0AAV7NRM2_PLEWA|nr:hypothetical protein NDU88_004123 [Pleurodeles waltl]